MNGGRDAIMVGAVIDNQSERGTTRAQPNATCAWKPLPLSGANTAPMRRARCAWKTAPGRWGSTIGAVGSIELSAKRDFTATAARGNGYEQYEVARPFTVERAEIAPAFGQPGGGYQIQYRVPEVIGRPATVNELIRFGYIIPRN